MNLDWQKIIATHEVIGVVGLPSNFPHEAYYENQVLCVTLKPDWKKEVWINPAHVQSVTLSKLNLYEEEEYLKWQEAAEDFYDKETTKKKWVGAADSAETTVPPQKPETKCYLALELMSPAGHIVTVALLPQGKGT